MFYCICKLKKKSALTFCSFKLQATILTNLGESEGFFFLGHFKEIKIIPFVECPLLTVMFIRKKCITQHTSLCGASSDSIEIHSISEIVLCSEKLNMSLEMWK